MAPIWRKNCIEEASRDALEGNGFETVEPRPRWVVENRVCGSFRIALLMGISKKATVNELETVF